jgi:anti-anti-sigma factor
MYELEQRGRTTVVHVSGDIDVLTSQSFRDTVAAVERDAERVTISLLDCPYLDSTGLTVLIAAQKRLGDRFSVVLPDGGNVRKIIEIASLGDFLNIVPATAKAGPAPTSP